MTFYELADYPPPRCGNPNCNGWIGRDSEARPIPCLQCRPHLSQTVDVNDCSKELL